jgi:hypothetical protein
MRERADRNEKKLFFSVIERERRGERESEMER